MIFLTTGAVFDIQVLLKLIGFEAVFILQDLSSKNKIWMKTLVKVSYQDFGIGT